MKNNVRFLYIICTVALIFVAVFSIVSFVINQSENEPNYSFSLVWNTYGISSYDSKTGKLIKTKDATEPNRYITFLQLSEEQYAAIWELIEDLDIESYPDVYDPTGNIYVTPYETLILSVKAEGIDKKVAVYENTLYFSSDEKARKFLDVCRGIEEILTGTNEWKKLPEYEFFYD